MNADPYNLDQTKFSEVVRSADDLLAGKTPTPEPPHPLRDDPHIAALCDHLRRTEDELHAARKSDGDMGDDAYFRFNEGLELRPEVIAKLVIDHIKQNPHLLAD